MLVLKLRIWSLESADEGILIFELRLRQRDCPGPGGVLL